MAVRPVSACVPGAGDTGVAGSGVLHRCTQGVYKGVYGGCTPRTGMRAVYGAWRPLLAPGSVYVRIRTLFRFLSVSRSSPFFSPDSSCTPRFELVGEYRCSRSVGSRFMKLRTHSHQRAPLRGLLVVVRVLCFKNLLPTGSHLVGPGALLSTQSGEVSGFGRLT